MRRFFIVLVVVFLAVSSFASAETTKQIDAFEFQTLFAKRYTKFLIDNDLDYNFHASSINVPIYETEEITVTTSAGTLTLDAKDFTIKNVLMTLIDVSASDEANESLVLICLMAMSALECNDLEERMLPLRAKLNPAEPADAIELIVNLWNNELYENINAALDAPEDEVFVYSGNYDYFLIYYTGLEKGAERNYYLFEARSK